MGDEIFTGLTVVAFSLQDISEADGGFACIPSASHSPLHAALEPALFAKPQQPDSSLTPVALVAQREP